MSPELENSMRFRVFIAALALLTTFGGPAFARGDTLDSILPDIRAEHPGRLSDAEPFTGPDGATHYRIKWMTPDGRILFFDANTRTGRYNLSGGGNGDRWNNGGGRWNDNGRDEDDDDGDRRPRNNWGNGDSGGSGPWQDGRGGRWRDNTGGDWGGRGGRGDWGGHGGDNGGRHGGGRHGRDN